MSIDSVGVRIKALRKQKGYTLKILSAKAKISISFLSDIENGRSKPSLERLQDIAVALETTTSYLMNESSIEHLSSRPISPVSEDDKTITKDDEKEIEKIVDNFRKKFNSEGLMFDGKPASPEAVQSILDAMEFGLMTAMKRNKEKNSPKK